MKGLEPPRYCYFALRSKRSMSTIPSHPHFIECIQYFNLKLLIAFSIFDRILLIAISNFSRFLLFSKAFLVLKVGLEPTHLATPDS
jgi:hypothetical protein